MIKNFLNPEGHQNPISGSKVMAILLKGWILSIDGASAGEGRPCSLRSRLILCWAQSEVAFLHKDLIGFDLKLVTKNICCSFINHPSWHTLLTLFVTLYILYYLVYRVVLLWNLLLQTLWTNITNSLYSALYAFSQYLFVGLEFHFIIKVLHLVYKLHIYKEI